MTGKPVIHKRNRRKQEEEQHKGQNFHNVCLKDSQKTEGLLSEVLDGTGREVIRR